MLRKAPVGVELARSDACRRAEGETSQGGNGRVRITAKARTPVVTVSGDPAELTLWTMGRTSVADVQMEGNDSDVAALRATSWRAWPGLDQEPLTGHRGSLLDLRAGHLQFTCELFCLYPANTNH